MGKQEGGTVLRASLAAGLIGLGLVAAVMEVHADLAPHETRRAAYRLHLESRWRAHVGMLDQALARHDVSAAVGAWHDAYGAALASRGWEGMLAVGDAFLRIGAEAGTVSGSRSNARQAYLNALVRAHPRPLGGRAAPDRRRVRGPGGPRGRDPLPARRRRARGQPERNLSP
jgi:hypothetical protein